MEPFSHNKYLHRGRKTEPYSLEKKTVYLRQAFFNAQEIVGAEILLTKERQKMYRD